MSLLFPLCIFFYVQCVPCFHSILLVAFHVCNLGYSSWEFILVVLRLLFQKFINCSSKVAWNSSHWCSMRWTVLSLILQLLAKNLLIGISMATLPLFATRCIPFLLQEFIMQVLGSIANGSHPDNPTLYLTFIHILPLKILAP